MYLSESSIYKNKAFDFSNFGQFLSHFISIRLIRGFTYTQVNMVNVERVGSSKPNMNT
jgi:hypothetical protein